MSAGPSEIVSNTETAVSWETLAKFMRQMLVTLDGLWFMNVKNQLGDQKTMEMDVAVFIAQFKIATRLWREMNRLDGTSAKDKASVFQAMAHLYGHKFDIIATERDVTMRLTQCAFLENLKKAGRAGEHDCRRLCQKLAPAWFKEIEPRTGGQGSVDLTLPIGGDRCDWTVAQPV